jgi:hypothetical protein
MPVEQHPVPQNISTYEFRLIGDMTLKQFGYLAVGVIAGIIIYGTPLAPFIKWPLILLFGFSGVAFAFMPIEGRPLSVWLVAFFKSIYSPTQFIWQKKLKKLAIFEPVSPLAREEKNLSPSDKVRLEEYLQTLLPHQKTDEQAQKEAALLELFKTTSPLPPRENLPPKKEPEIKKPTKEVKEVKMPKPPIEEFILHPRTKKPIAARFGPNLPFPNPPSRPNIVAGMVLDKYGEIIEGAILEIRNQDGLPVRALKSNKLGQFTIATPLENGSYEMEIEKEGYQFDIINIEAKGEIIPPIEIKEKSEMRK